MLPKAVTRSSSYGIAICYEFLILQMTSCFHTMGPMDGWAQYCVVFCVVVPDGVVAGQVQAAAANCIASSAGRLAGVAGTSRRPGRVCWFAVLAVRELHSAADRNGGAHFAKSFMPAVSCEPGAKSSICDCLITYCIFLTTLSRIHDMGYFTLKSTKSSVHVKIMQCVSCWMHDAKVQNSTFFHTRHFPYPAGVPR